jgi:preprotein translocase subunit Sec61beta
MKLFRRKNSDTNQVPAGLESYYDQQSGWKLWVRRIVGIVAIIVLLALLFWAGRWVYNSVTGSGDEPSGPTTSEESGNRDPGLPDEIANPNESNGGTGGGSGSNGGGSTNTPPSSDAPAPGSGGSGGTGGSSGGGTTTDGSPEALPSTGG